MAHVRIDSDNELVRHHTNVYLVGVKEDANLVGVWFQKSANTVAVDYKGAYIVEENQRPVKTIDRCWKGKRVTVLPLSVV